MSAPRMPWFRMYTDFLNDSKMISLAFEDQRHFIGILALKSDGAIDDSCDEVLLDRIVAQRMWIDHGVIRDVKKRLVNAGLIESNWQPVAWDKRQRVSDRDSTAAERKRRERASKVNKSSVTQQSRVTKSDSHATVTRLDTDTDTEEDTDKTAGFDSFWSAYPKKTAKPAALLKFKSAKLKAGELDSILIDIETRSQSDDWTKENGKYVPNPATYLNQRRWEDGETAHMRKPGGVLPGAI